MIHINHCADFSFWLFSLLLEYHSLVQSLLFIFVPLSLLTSLLKVSQICMVYFWALHSVLFTHVFDFVPVPWCYTTALKCNLKSESVSTSSFLLTQLLWLFVECNGSIWKLYLNIAIEILSKPPSIMEIS